MLKKLYTDLKREFKSFAETGLAPLIVILVVMLVIGVVVAGLTLGLSKLFHFSPDINFIHERKPLDQQPFFCAFYEKENELKCMPYVDFLEMLRERNKEDGIKL